MGFIKQLLGGIFSLLGSIFGGLAKLVGLGKKSEYFLEAEPVDSAAMSEPQAAASTKASAVNSSGQSATAASNGSAASTSKKKKISKKAAQAEAAASATPTPVAATPAVPVNVTFAPDYLITANSRSGRRRPGPSMNPFRDMARQVNSQN